jgi:hypothetical protein
MTHISNMVVSNGIRDVRVDLPANGEGEVEVLFGPHHGLRISEQEGTVQFRLVATHHGFEANATGDDLPTQLEECIEVIRKERDDLVVESF